MGLFFGGSHSFIPQQFHSTHSSFANACRVVFWLQAMSFEEKGLAAAAAARKRSSSDEAAEKKDKKKSKHESAQDGEALMTNDLTEADEADAPYKMPKSGRTTLAAETAKIKSKRTVVPDAVAQKGQKIQLSPLDRTKRTLYKPPSFGRMLYESRRANPAARKITTKNPFGAIGKHCSMCREPLGKDTAPEPERVPYIRCTTGDCKRWYHKRCVAKLHECFFPDGAGAEVDLMDTSTFIFVCPRCIFCHDPDCKVAAADTKKPGAGAYSLKAPGQGDKDAYSWPGYRRCDDCEAVFHIVCAKYRLCTYCHRNAKFVKASDSA
jgi:hypothetical protein